MSELCDFIFGPCGITMSRVIDYGCAKRSFPSVVPENRLSVVRPDNMFFCEEDLEVARMLLSTGSLNLRFSGSKK